MFYFDLEGAIAKSTFVSIITLMQFIDLGRLR
jgi:hypothetical protein